MDSIGKALLVIGAILLLLAAALKMGVTVFYIACILLIIGGVLVLEDYVFESKLINSLLMLGIGSLASLLLMFFGGCF